MTKRAGFVVALVCATFLFQGCAVVTTQPLTGFIFSDVHFGGVATDAEVGTKSGMATAQSILGAVALDDCSLNAAATDGGITRISHVDYHAWSILGIYARLETYVYGD